MKQKIGTVTVDYDNQGKVLNVQFESSINAKLPQSVVEIIPVSPIMSVLQENADKVISSWFSKITDIELNKKIVSEVCGCERFKSNAIKRCVLTYYYED